MEPQRQVRDHHRARLLAREGHLVVGLGVVAGRMHADRRQAQRRDPPEPLHRGHVATAADHSMGL